MIGPEPIIRIFLMSVRFGIFQLGFYCLRLSFQPKLPNPVIPNSGCCLTGVRDLHVPLPLDTISPVLTVNTADEHPLPINTAQPCHPELRLLSNRGEGSACAVAFGNQVSARSPQVG